jgi:hypothetical protein
MLYITLKVAYSVKSHKKTVAKNCRLQRRTKNGGGEPDAVAMALEIGSRVEENGGGRSWCRRPASPQPPPIYVRLALASGAGDLILGRAGGAGPRR